MKRDFPEAVVFDLDGTLVDTGPDLTASLNHVLRQVGLAPVPLAAVRDMIGLGARSLIERGMAYHQAQIGPDRLEILWRNFLDFYESNICIYSMPYPGVIEALTRLQTRGVKLGICTNKPEALSHKLIKILGMSKFFHTNLGADSLPVRKPNPDHLFGVLSNMKCDPLHAVMVGDSMVDVNTARNAKIPIVAVTFGFTDIPAKDFGADALLDHYGSLDAALETAHSRR
jgi:phosphoglycolate phosphatase